MTTSDKSGRIFAPTHAFQRAVMMERARRENILPDGHRKHTVMGDVAPGLNPLIRLKVGPEFFYSNRYLKASLFDVGRVPPAYIAPLGKILQTFRKEGLPFVLDKTRSDEGHIFTFRHIEQTRLLPAEAQKITAMLPEIDGLNKVSPYAYWGFGHSVAQEAWITPWAMSQR